MTDLPDVTDPDIRRMVLRNHEPTESWTYGGKVDVHCATCWKSWPCPSRQAALEADKEYARGRPLPPLFPPGESEPVEAPRRKRRWFGG